MPDTDDMLEYRISQMEKRIEEHLHDCAEYRKEASTRYVRIMFALLAILGAAVFNLVTTLLRQ